MDLIEIGDAIRARRKSLKLTLPELAELSGVSRARISALEHHRVADIGFKRLARILRALELDLRVTSWNQRRPTLEDLQQEEDR